MIPCFHCQAEPPFCVCHPKGSDPVEDYRSLVTEMELTIKGLKAVHERLKAAWFRLPEADRPQFREDRTTPWCWGDW